MLLDICNGVHRKFRGSFLLLLFFYPIIFMYSTEDNNVDVQLPCLKFLFLLLFCLFVRLFLVPVENSMMCHCFYLFLYYESS